MTEYVHRMSVERRIEYSEERSIPYFKHDGQWWFCTQLSDGWDVGNGNLDQTFFVQLGRNCGLGKLIATFKKQYNKAKEA